MAEPLRIVSWNVAGKAETLGMLDGFDFALLQESPTSTKAERIPSGPGPARILGLNSAVRLEPVELVSITDAAANPDATPVSYPGTLAAANVLDAEGQPILTLVSVYVKWEKNGNWIVPDASAHRLVSDISSLITTERHAVPLIVAGDWNLFFGAGETPYWKARYGTVFDRLDAMGLDYLGPTAGLHRQPPPGQVTEWPETATPTFHTTRQTPETAWRQLDHVFASKRIADRVNVTALNQPDEWGPSDHCRIAIEIDL